MSRYEKYIPFNGNVDAVYEEIYQGLTKKRFKYIDYNNEIVFRKGNGFWTLPTFIKVTFNDKFARVEAWNKLSYFPGIYFGEYDMDSFIGWAIKGTMKKGVALVENLLQTYNNYNPQINNTPQDS